MFHEVFLIASLPLEKNIKNRFDRGSDTCGSFEEGKKVDR